MSRDIRRKSGVLRRRLEEEIQSSVGLLFRRQASAAAAAKVNEVHKILVRGGQQRAGEMDDGYKSREVRQAVDGKLSYTRRRACPGGSGPAGARKIVLCKLDRRAAAVADSVQHDERQCPTIHGNEQAQQRHGQQHETAVR